jgi:hypothetical protein
MLATIPDRQVGRCGESRGDPDPGLILILDYEESQIPFFLLKK